MMSRIVLIISFVSAFISWFDLNSWCVRLDVSTIIIWSTLPDAANDGSIDCAPFRLSFSSFVALLALRRRRRSPFFRTFSSKCSLAAAGVLPAELNWSEVEFNWVVDVDRSSRETPLIEMRRWPITTMRSLSPKSWISWICVNVPIWYTSSNDFTMSSSLYKLKEISK